MLLINTILIIFFFLATVLFATIASIKYVPTTKVGVLLKSGAFCRLVDPGPLVVWPFGHQLVIVDTEEQAINLANQTFHTKDKISLSLDTRVYYQISDPTKAYTELLDIEKALETSTQKALSAILKNKTSKELEDSYEAVKETLERQLSRMFAKNGLVICTVEVKDISL